MSDHIDRATALMRSILEPEYGPAGPKPKPSLVHASWERHVILVSQVGDLARYVSHDQEINPLARPHGTREDEAATFGHAFVQLAALAVVRGVDLKAGIETALRAMEERDWERREGATDGSVRGQVAHWQKGWEHVEGIACLTAADVAAVPTHGPPAILLLEHARADVVTVLKKGWLGAIVTDQGGITCHAAIVAREYDLSCVVGTGNATKRFRAGQRIVVLPDGRVEEA